MVWNLPNGLKRRLSLLDEADEEQQNNGPDHGCNQRADQATSGQAQYAEQKPAEVQPFARCDKPNDGYRVPNCFP